MVGSYFIHKALSGEMNGDYPTDEKEKNRWKDLQIQPNSMQIGKSWHSLDRLGPYSMVGRISANLAHVFQTYDGKDEGAMTQAIFASVLGTAKVLAGDVGFETLRNIVDVMENPRSASRFAAWQLSSYVMPVSLVTQTASFMDPYMRQADSLIKGFKYHIPLLRETLAPKRDPLYGEPEPNPGYHAILRSTQTNLDPVKTEMDRLHYYPAEPGKTIGNVKLTPEQYDKYEATAGPLVKRMLTATVTQPGWENKPPAIRKEIMQAVVTYAREKAESAMLRDNGGEIAKAARVKAIQEATGVP
jgi:hypothetical protein